LPRRVMNGRAYLVAGELADIPVQPGRAFPGGSPWQGRVRVPVQEDHDGAEQGEYLVEAGHEIVDGLVAMPHSQQGRYERDQRVGDGDVDAAGQDRFREAAGCRQQGSGLDGAGGLELLGDRSILRPGQDLLFPEVVCSQPGASVPARRTAWTCRSREMLPRQRSVPARSLSLFPLAQIVMGGGLLAAGEVRPRPYSSSRPAATNARW